MTQAIAIALLLTFAVCVGLSMPSLTDSYGLAPLLAAVFVTLVCSVLIIEGMRA